MKSLTRKHLKSILKEEKSFFLDSTMKSLTRKQLKRMLKEAYSINSKSLNEINFLGKEIVLDGGKITVDGKKWAISSGPVNLPITDMELVGDQLSVTIKPPYIPLASDGKPKTGIIKDPAKQQALADGFDSGNKFDIDIVNKDGETNTLTFDTA